jgi:hypothetical protein
MLSTTRSAASLALRGMCFLCPESCHLQLTLSSSQAKPTTALLPLRVGPSAFISSTSAKSATEITPSRDAQGPPLSVTGKPRREVPLPSQEKKEGVMQYALYVTSSRTSGSRLIFGTQNHARSSRQLGSPGFTLAYDVRSCLLRCRNDASFHPAI